MATVVNSLGFVYLLLNVCYCSPTTELLVIRLLDDCARFDPQAVLNLIVRLEVAVESVQRLLDSLDRGVQANAGRIPPLKSQQLQYLLHSAVATLKVIAKHNVVVIKALTYVFV